MQETAKIKIRTFLANYFTNYDLKDDEDIFSLGFVNSLFAMQLILFLENEFALAMENDELELDNFRTIERMSNLVARKKGVQV
ncbi:MAG: acyl carrier protein [Chloroflexi bacterium]|nr:acyl carrier protein [Chloroflexota bacterium]